VEQVVTAYEEQQQPASNVEVASLDAGSSGTAKAGSQEGGAGGTRVIERE
jgi:hypothetical protein